MLLFKKLYHKNPQFFIIYTQNYINLIYYILIKDLNISSLNYQL